jgi:OTU domain-containing protein 6
MESLDGLQSRHRKEAKDLQSRITQKKKGASKKTRKGVNSECEELERQLKERQAHEIAVLNGDDATQCADEGPEIEQGPPDNFTTTNEEHIEINSISEALEKATIPDIEPAEDGQPKKRNRAKERLARRAAETAAAVEEAKKEAANQPDPKALERKKMLSQFESRGLVEKIIRPDGHCLFSAVADQLVQIGIPLAGESDTELREDQRYKIVRKAAAAYIEGHPDEFVGWLDEPLGSYVEKIRDTAEWGGHLELLALARTYRIEICVIQDGDPQTIKPEEGVDKPEKIWLGYYRHGFGLGEHYNSLRKSP